MNQKLIGLIAAPFTPMDKEGNIQFDTIKEQAASLVENGMSGAFICGTTGEGLSLTTEERQQVAEHWLAVASKNLPVIIHVGHNSLGHARQLAAHAEQIGAHAFATLAPNFFRPSNVEQLVDYCAEVASAAPSLPFYFYHMPSMTGVNFAMIDFLKVASHRIPNLVGIKFTHENLMDYHQCLQFENGRFNILFGRDEILLSALPVGATGAVGSTYNYMAPIYQKVIDAFNVGDLETARRHQLHAIEIIQVMSRFGGLPAGKVMMKLIGVDCGSVRLPLHNLTTEEMEHLTGQLQKVGFPDHAMQTRVSDAILQNASA